MSKNHRPALVLATFGFALLAGCTASVPSKPAEPPKPKFTAVSLPDSCKLLVRNMKGCTDAMKDAPSMAKFCVKRVNERDAPACPMTHDEAKKILESK